MKPSKYITAETESYELHCAKTPMDSVHINRHLATISWQSGYGNEGQVPGKIELCVGGQLFTYKVEE